MFLQLYIIALLWYTEINLSSGQKLHKCDKCNDIHLHIRLFRFGLFHAEAVLIYDPNVEVRRYSSLYDDEHKF